MDDSEQSSARKIRKRRKSPLPSSESVASTESLMEKITAERSNDTLDKSETINEIVKVNMEELQADIAKYRSRESAIPKPATSFGEGLTDAFNWVLVADFFVVLGFLGWLLAGVAARSLFDNGTLLDQFSALWAPVIQPALGILMAGTIVGGTVRQLGQGDENES